MFLNLSKRVTVKDRTFDKKWRGEKRLIINKCIGLVVKMCMYLEVSLWNTQIEMQTLSSSFFRPRLET